MDRALNRNSALALGIFFLFALLGFWPNYFAILDVEFNWRFHFHTLSLVSWCVLMVLQAYLIRVNKRSTHRQMGKLSYLIVPMVIISSISLSHYQENTRELAASMFGLAIVTTLLLQFIVAYGLAIFHRRTPALHARFMICTALVMVTPIFARVISLYLIPEESAQFLPQIAGFPLYQIFTDSMVNLSLIALSIWDWRSRRKLNVFPVVLFAFVMFQSITYVAHHLEFWRVFTEWFLALPLS